MKHPIDFLTLAEVLEIHLDEINKFGGSHGVRDLKLLESAVATPQQSFGGEYLHHDLFEMAAAYAYHISQNHPFVDGNKRTGLAAALVFLELNRTHIADPEGTLYNTMLDMGRGRIDKLSFAAILKKLCK